MTFHPAKHHPHPGTGTAVLDLITPASEIEDLPGACNCTLTGISGCAEANAVPVWGLGSCPLPTRRSLVPCLSPWLGLAMPPTKQHLIQSALPTPYPTHPNHHSVASVDDFLGCDNFLSSQGDDTYYCYVVSPEACPAVQASPRFSGAGYRGCNPEVDAVVAGAPDSFTLWELVAESPSLSFLATALEVANLTDTLASAGPDGQGYTLFAPRCVCFGVLVGTWVMLAACNRRLCWDAEVESPVSTAMHQCTPDLLPSRSNYAIATFLESTSTTIGQFLASPKLLAILLNHVTSGGAGVMLTGERAPACLMWSGGKGGVCASVDGCHRWHSPSSQERSRGSSRLHRD